MTDHEPPPPGSPRQPDGHPPAKEPGFLLCGLMVFTGLIVVGAVMSTLAAVVNTGYAFSSGLGGLIVVAVALYFSIQSPRFRRCLLKGLAVVSVVGVVLFGACLALIQSAYP